MEKHEKIYIVVERKVFNLENTELLSRIKAIIPKFYSVKELATSYKKESDSLGNEIKKGMKELGESSLEVDGIIASYTETNRESFNEEALLAFLKSIPAAQRPKGLIKKVEKVDMDVLESAVYNGKINAADLQPFREIKPVPTLRVKVKK